MNPDFVLFMRYVRACHRLVTGSHCRSFTDEELIDDFCAMLQDKHISLEEFKANLQAFNLINKESPEPTEEEQESTVAELKTKGLVK